MRNRKFGILKWALAWSVMLGCGAMGLRAQSSTIDPPRIWATSIGGVNLDFITDAVGDGLGGLYVTGYTNSPNFPTTLAGSPGSGYDIFVAHYDSLGTVLWSTRYGGSGSDFGNAIARDGAGNLVVAGKLGGHGPFVTDSTYKGSGDDIVVLKVTGTGAFVGAVRYGGSAADEAVGIAVDATNQVVVVGNSSSTNISTTSATYNGTSGDAFLLRLRSNLTRHWAFRYGGNSFDKANDVAIDGSGNVYVAGETGSSDYQQTINTYQGSGGAKSFVMRFDSLGARAWAQRYGGSGVERAYALDLPANGGLLVAGYTTSADFPATISGLGGAGLDAFLLHLNLDGTRDYARRLGGSLDDLAIDIVTDGTGNVFMAGETQSINFPSTNNRFKGQGRDHFMAKFGPAGDYVWSFPYGGAQNDFSGGSVTAMAASVYLAGHTQSTNFPQTSPGTGGNTARGTVMRLRDCVGQRANFTYSNVCEFDTVHFTNLSVQGTSDTVAYRWWFGDGDSTDAIQPSHYYATPGAYAVTLRLKSPCGLDSSVTKTVHVYPAPRAAWTSDVSCATAATHFTDSTTLDTVLASVEDSWSWTFGTGATAVTQNPSYTYGLPGSYPVLFTVWTNHGCSDTASGIVNVHYLPTADFSVSNICLRDTARFLDQSTVGGDSITTWAWDFGVNGANSSDQNPSYAYAAADTYAVTLVVTTDFGCTDTLIDGIVVRPLPVVDFGMTEVCWPTDVDFADSSSIQGDTITGYSWRFGDGAQDTAAVTSHGYATGGNYDVVLWVYTASGCGDSLAQPLTLHAQPVADFTAPTVCWPETTIFQDQSTVAADSITAWAWDFGDAASDTVQHPEHNYQSPGTYSVTLSVTSGFGCTHSFVQDVDVSPKPDAGFTATDACEPLPTTFVNTSTVQGDIISGFDWDFGDGNTGTGLISFHQYSGPGAYQVTLVVESFLGGCRDTIQDSVYVFAQPDAAFTVDNACDGDTVFFHDSTSIAVGSVVSYNYAFGDGNGANAAETSWVYGQPGNYTAILTVTSDHNCIDIATRPVTVHALPDPNPVVEGYADICQGDTAMVRELQSFVQYSWETGDTTPAISVAERSDWIVLTVVDSNACENLDSVEVRFHNVPRPNAVIVPGPVVSSCADDSLFLEAGGSYFSYEWNDGEITNRRHVASSGPYWVLVHNGFGCADTSELAVVTILPAPATPTISQNGSVLTSSFGAAYQWYFNGLAIPNATTAQWTAMATGSYQVAVFTADGCDALSEPTSLTVSAADAMVGAFEAYPNPCSDVLHLRGELAKGGSMEVRVVNTLGQVVHTQTQVVPAGALELDLGMATLPAGYYLLDLRLGTARMQHTLIKQ